MSKIKLVVTDMDGTIVKLLSHDVSDAVRQAVIAAEDKGVKVVPVTGRPYEQAKPAMVTLGFDSLGVFDGGASIREAMSGELVWSKWLDEDTIRQILEVVLPHSKRIDFDPTWDDHEPDSDVQVELSKIKSKAPYVYTIVPDAAIAGIQSKLAVISDITFHFTPMGKYENCSDSAITHRLATKFFGVDELGRLLGVDRENILAIGDGNNDLPLFENAGLKIAMGNATDELKAKADYIVGSVEDDGFAEAMQRFVLA